MKNGSQFGACLLVIGVLASGCKSKPKFVTAGNDRETYCAVALRKSYIDVEDVIRPRIGYPKAISKQELRHNGWICTENNDPFDYFFLEHRGRPVFLDTTAHDKGYLVALGRDQVAVVPKAAYPAFRRGLERGEFVIRDEWLKSGDRLR